MCVDAVFDSIACIQNIFGEFDSGSERTLAAWLRHASRTEYHGSNIVVFSGERVRNTWVTCREVGDSPGKLGLIPHVVERPKAVQAAAS